jgi:hypothetical protein
MGLPHFPQNRVPSAWGVWQFGQIIALPLSLAYSLAMSTNQQPVRPDRLHVFCASDDLTMPNPP